MTRENLIYSGAMQILSSNPYYVSAYNDQEKAMENMKRAIAWATLMYDTVHTREITPAPTPEQQAAPEVPKEPKKKFVYVIESKFKDWKDDDWSPTRKQEMQGKEYTSKKAAEKDIKLYATSKDFEYRVRKDFDYRVRKEEK